VVQCSASNTAPTFTDYDDNGFYFRTAPSDALQGPVLAEIVLEDDHTNVALIGRADDYGRGLIEAARDTLEEAGAEIVYFDTYDPEAVTFDAEVSEILAADPDAIVMVTFEEGVQMLQTLIEQGWDPANTYGADGIRDEGLNESVDPDDEGVIDGFQGTAPDPGAVEGFMDQLAEFDPDLDVTIFAPQAYDCGMMIMLAAEAAESTNPDDIREQMLEITTGDNECEGFEECAELLRDGETISYRFAGGTAEMSDVGEPVNGTYEVWEWSDGELTSVDSREVFAEEAE
jgi:ABC-type branched-subunit amino acid transport system substrate-binding protein